MTPDTWGGSLADFCRRSLSSLDTQSGVRSVVVTIHLTNQSLVILDKYSCDWPPFGSFVQPQEQACSPGQRLPELEITAPCEFPLVRLPQQETGLHKSGTCNSDTAVPSPRCSKLTVPIPAPRNALCPLAYQLFRKATPRPSNPGVVFQPSFSQTWLPSLPNSSPLPWTPQKESLHETALEILLKRPEQRSLVLAYMVYTKFPETTL